MDRNKEYFTEDIVVFLAQALPHPQYFAVKVLNNIIPWRHVLLIYSGLLTISTFILNSIFEFHADGKTLDNIKLAFFQTIYIFIFSAVIRCVMFLFKGDTPYEKTLKLYFIYGGVINIFNSMLMIFNIYLIEGGNRFIVFLASSLAAVWIIWSYVAILKINNINGVIKKISAILLLIFLSFLLSKVLSVMTPYFITW
ncbi:TPA: hypothetical protein ACTXFX_004846 [Raoultella planticola]